MTRVLGFSGSEKYPQGILKSINCLLGVVKLAVGSRLYCLSDTEIVSFRLPKEPPQPIALKREEIRMSRSLAS